MLVSLFPKYPVFSPQDVKHLLFNKNLPDWQVIHEVSFSLVQSLQVEWQLTHNPPVTVGVADGD